MKKMNSATWMMSGADYLVNGDVVSAFTKYNLKELQVWVCLGIYVLCRVVLCCVVLCCVVLCCVVLCCVMLCCVVLCCVVLCCVVLCHVVLCCVMLCCVVFSRVSMV